MSRSGTREQAALAGEAWFHAHMSAYQHLQNQQPMSLAHALTDSPAGYLGWLNIVFRGGMGLDFVLTQARRPGEPMLAAACSYAYTVGMHRGKANGRQYTIRNVPAAVDRALRQKAAKSRQSLNEIALQALAAAAQVSIPGAQDLDGFFGSWVEDPETDRALGAQRQVDEELWR